MMSKQLQQISMAKLTNRTTIQQIYFNLLVGYFHQQQDHLQYFIPSIFEPIRFHLLIER